MNRRKFIKLSAGALGGVACGDALSGCLHAAEVKPEAIAAFFQWKDPAVGQLTEKVFQKCILSKLFPPEAPLQRNWIGPGGGYKGQWIWDTMFVVDLLSILPGKKKIIRDVFQNYWDFQDRWNKRMPEYAHDMVTANIKPSMDNVKWWPMAQIPILAWGLERVYSRNHDKELLKQCLAPTERFHEWYWRERDVTDIGLIAVGSYNGKIRWAKWETFDEECCMDGVKIPPTPRERAKRKAPGTATSALQAIPPTW
jgi:hypothetical protein